MVIFVNLVNCCAILGVLVKTTLNKSIYFGLIGRLLLFRVEKIFQEREKIMSKRGADICEAVDQVPIYCCKTAIPTKMAVYGT